MNTGQPDPTKVPRYCGISTIFRLPYIEESCDIGILGIPFDGGVTFRPGARFGPESIRANSRLYREYNPEMNIYPFKDKKVGDLGDIACTPFDNSMAVDQIYENIIEKYKSSKNLIFLGGDHTVSYPILKAVNEKFGTVCLIHFDSHLDTWDEYFGEKHTHGTPFKRAVDNNYINGDKSIHIGVHGTTNDESDFVKDKNMGFTVISTKQVNIEYGIKGTIDRIKNIVGNNPCYISVDIDVVDPAYAPGTGTPEVGGLTSFQLITILQELKGINIVGGDVVEVSPQYDSNNITSLLAARVCYELLCLI